MSAEEQRKSPRLERGFMVRYRVADELETIWRMSPLRDLSSGGAHFLCERWFANGTRLLLQLLVPGSPEPVALTARVTWLKRGDGKLFQCGVTFEAADARTRQIIQDVVARYLGRCARS